MPTVKYSHLARAVDRIADRLAIGHGHVVNYPAALAAAGIDAEDVTPAVVAEARRYHVGELVRIAERGHALLYLH